MGKKQQGPSGTGRRSVPLHDDAASSRERPAGAAADQLAPGPATPAAPPLEPVEDGPPPDREARRRFVVRISTVLGCLALGEAAWITGSFLRPRQRDGGDESLFVAGPLDRFDPGSVTAFPSGRFYLVRLNDGGFLALHRECTHLGCTVPWDAAQGRFACPCHASAFDITGQVINPPAPRPLDYYQVRIENGIVKVDTRRRLSRSAFDAAQVTGV